MRFITHRVLNLLTAVLIVAAVSFPVLAAGARQTFTWQKPAGYVTFNSITNNPAVGNEENFLAVRDLNQANYSQSLKVNNGQEIVFRIYYDNNAGHNLNLTAKNTRLSLAIPAKSAKTAVATAYISADNAKPELVSASATLSADSPFSLHYEKGSAQIWNNTWRGKTLSDSIVSSGVQLGYKSLDGKVPGGAKASGYVTVKAKVNFSQNSASQNGGGAAAGAIGGSNSGKGGQPAEVPNTGPGSLLAIFLAVSAAGYLGRLVIARRSR
ncbi:MAG TPA: hypothetical protein VFP35_00235 [Candidatus Saccharimonadales bacterium]|nr:hypothetical protein [Candidatus Saccharimonadales bacterium]